MKKNTCLFAMAAVLTFFSRLANADCQPNAGQVQYISYFGAQPFFSLVEYPMNYTFDPGLTPEQRRILLDLLQVAAVNGTRVLVLCNTTTNPASVMGLSIRRD
ncbi:hypothetical protein BOSP111201_17295 [Bordetella sputigena]|uniref:hypothetical protein n=1 Tax=Bordetella sputigena TaxID=1416810 RepID=UPI0039EE8AE5